MKNFLKAIILASFALVLLAACGGNDGPSNTGQNVGNDTEESPGSTKNSEGEDSGDKLQVVSSFTIITDMVREVGGDKVEVHNLVPTGTDPHEYEPLPEDSKKATDADILFYNGMNLEGGENGWFFKMIDSVGQDRAKAYSLTERIEPMYLRDEATREEEVNPHSFIDPVVGIHMVEDMRDAFIEVDPDNKEYYEKRANDYLDRLKEIEKEYEERLGALPEENKILVTSECAFQYMLNRYDMGEECIWRVDTEENGSPEQITSLIKFIDENNVPILFLESNVDPRPMETVSKESGVEIYEKPIYSDEIGNPGDEVDTYIKYLKYNIDIISDGLSK
ncbi:MULTISPECIES: metal ABC transporter solute-binding protein, Zn/Mn family [Bacillaceae]|uniref:Zinc ABC transporter substrate-binding protein n=1 Tax=Oceanobacillus caeni TaxID=405946 RepID=A0ABR5MNE3_9BACI|nr:MULTISPECIES: zinc ABC transporter substrate-binding protein [Bacillaceae]KKE79597.1 zinc ABC transporter substrate-binding protein [Bacilli bacterium VT-13-104]PZD89690.1 zinc ABC transporter substrate-binding protein [Bacilli bacterium]KPH78751.1 zinc ABC transporter substrate-binding protein [Oceanobacillus caeni]MED4474948.1 zinc ABC transporter substrate-binding protein [Oceanobacillus caeni]PZD91212.1 zinc ABC transporter substrate-binding protein [Bacilli bacterium]